MLGAATARRVASEGEQRAREPFAEGPCPTIAAGPCPTIASAAASSSVATTSEGRPIVCPPRMYDSYTSTVGQYRTYPLGSTHEDRAGAGQVTWGPPCVCDMEAHARLSLRDLRPPLVYRIPRNNLCGISTCKMSSSAFGSRAVPCRGCPGLRASRTLASSIARSYTSPISR